jgi:hypothetical protein
MIETGVRGTRMRIRLLVFKLAFRAIDTANECVRNGLWVSNREYIKTLFIFVFHSTVDTALRVDVLGFHCLFLHDFTLGICHLLFQ